MFNPAHRHGSCHGPNGGLPSNDPPNYSATAPSLDPLETTVDDTAWSPSYVPETTRTDLNLRFRHSGWKRRRIETYAAMTTIGTPPDVLERFAKCGCDAWIYRDTQDPLHVKIRASCCHNRWCVPCSTQKRLTLTNNLRVKLPQVPLRLITLTLRATHAPLADQLNRLTECFRRLRHHPLIKPRLTGGLSFLEITLNPKSQLWHPHLHLLAQGRYIPQGLLSQIWHQLTGDSHIVDIRTVHNPDQAAVYVAKYAAKSCDTSVWSSPPHLVEAMLALRGKRTFNTFGTWTALGLSKLPDDDTDWECVEPLYRVILRAQSGDPIATALLSLLNRRLYAYYSDLDPDYDTDP